MSKICACELCNNKCMVCWYSDQCGYYNDTADASIPMVEVDEKEVSMALCKGRHEIPEAIDGAIFDSEVNPLKVAELEAEAKHKLEKLGCKVLNLYVTGLTVALVAVLNACRELGITVWLYHYDRETGSYYSQAVK